MQVRTREQLNSIIHTRNLPTRNIKHISLFVMHNNPNCVLTNSKIISGNLSSEKILSNRFTPPSLSFLNFSSATIPDLQSPQAIILVKANSLVPNEDLDIGNARLLAGASGRRQFVYSDPRTRSSPGRGSRAASGFLPSCEPVSST